MPKCALHARRDTGLAHAQLLELAEAIHSCCLPALPGAILQRHTPSLASVSASGPPVPFQRLCFFVMTSGVMRGRQDGGLAPTLTHILTMCGAARSTNHALWRATWSGGLTFQTAWKFPRTWARDDLWSRLLAECCHLYGLVQLALKPLGGWGGGLSERASGLFCLG